MTLLEVMVVLTIIGVILSFAVLRVGDRGQSEALRREAERFGALVSMAQEQAILEGREYGVAVEDDGYTFSVLSDDDWRPLESDDLFRERRLPEGVAMELEAEALKVDLTRSETARDPQEPELEPQILVLSSGELTPFGLTLYTQDTELAYQVQGKADGSLTVERVPSP
jgi:general secretion pathway protein H